nr:uncharacterized protein LOC127345819 isoform X2 [Lolium perenne]
MRRHRSPTCSPTPAASAASTQTSSWSPPPYPYPHPAFPPLSATPRLTLAVGFVTVAAAAPPSPRGGGGVLSVQIGGAAAAVLRGVISPEQQPRMPGAGAGVRRRGLAGPLRAPPRRGDARRRRLRRRVPGRRAGARGRPLRHPSQAGARRAAAPMEARSFINKAWRIRLAMDMAAIVNRSLASMHRAYFSASG